MSILCPLKMILVLDHFDALMSNANSDGRDHISDVKVFFGRIFERCRFVKILTTCTNAPGASSSNNLRAAGDSSTRSRSHSNSYVGVNEHVITLGPLNIRSSLRLFARLSPILLTASAKSKFVSDCYPKGLIHSSAFSNMTIRSSDLTEDGLLILSKLGSGFPSRIMKLASESTHESIYSFIGSLHSNYSNNSSSSSSFSI